MQDVRIEDKYEDVVQKSLRGLDIRPSDLVARTGLSTDSIENFLKSEVIEWTEFKAISAVLQLQAQALGEMAKGVAAPDVKLPPSVLHFNTPYPLPGYEEMTVNSFAFIPDTPADLVIAIDTGASPSGLLDAIVAKGRRLSHLFLTHTHGDHVAAFSDLQGLGAQSFSPEKEPFRECCPISPGDNFDFGAYRLKALRTSGHSPGGMSYLLSGLETPIAFVGDAIFCLSMGKAHGIIERAKQEVRENLLSLPPKTILCPGHGPLTTVAFEREHNPFFAN